MRLDHFVANVDDGMTAHWIKLTAKDDGSFELVNGRTGVARNKRAKGKKILP